jgi:hypothetical protein
VHTGAGIVAGSVPEREFEETEHKSAAMRRAIQTTTAGTATATAATAKALATAGEHEAERSQPAIAGRSR